jgi:transposase
MSKSLFINWVKDILCPNLIPGQIVILDNASFHKDEELYDIIEERGCKLIYLPPYSPDLNPIEKFWANFKRNLRKIIKKFNCLMLAITYAIQITLSG